MALNDTCSVLAADGWGIPFLTFGALNTHDDIKNKKYTNQSHSCMQIHYVIYFGKLHKLSNAWIKSPGKSHRRMMVPYIFSSHSKIIIRLLLLFLFKQAHIKTKNKHHIKLGLQLSAWNPFPPRTDDYHSLPSLTFGGTPDQTDWLTQSPMPRGNLFLRLTRGDYYGNRTYEMIIKA